MTEEMDGPAEACLRRIEAMRRELDQLGFEIRALANYEPPDADEPEPPVSGPRPPARQEQLTILQAAEVFQLSRKWLQTHWKDIKGAGKFGRKQVRIPRAGLLKFMQTGRDNA